MSKSKRMMFTCPKCKNKSELVMWDSVNATLNPELKESIMNRKFFDWECSDCGEIFSINYSFLYNDMVKKYMIYLGDDVSGFSAAINEFGVPDGYKFRAVTVMIDLIEKIKIFDNDLDDRGIEIVKSLLKDLEKTDGEIKFHKAVGDTILFFDLDRQSIIKLSNKTYKDSFKLFEHNEERGFIKIDGNWVNNIINEEEL